MREISFLGLRRGGLLLATCALSGVVAMAGGCRDRSRLYPPKHETPPPKPPSCPSNVDVSPLRLPNGRLADVRIVQVLHTKLYIPTDWLMASWHLVDFEKTHYGERQGAADYDPPYWTTKRDYTPRFTPDIHLEECPGIVHQTNDKLAGYSSIIIRFQRRDGVNMRVQNVSPHSAVQEIELTQNGERGGETAAGSAADLYRQQLLQKHRRLRQANHGSNDWLRVGMKLYIDSEDQKDDLNPELGIVFNLPRSSTGIAEQWVLPEVMFQYAATPSPDELDRSRTLRPIMRKLAEWLATPPSRRDNNRIFLLGEKPS